MTDVKAGGDLAPAAGRAARRRELCELARVFLRLGTIGFGGPAAHIALMEEEVVRRRGWLSHAEFLDLLAITNLLPGPNSTEMAIHIGRERAGWRGLLVAGACFIAPAFATTLALAWAYVRWGALPAAAGLLYGVKPVILAVVLVALWRLARTAATSRALAALGVLAAAANAAGANELAVLAAAGLLAVAAAARGTRGQAAAALLGAPATGAGIAAAGAAVPFSLAGLFLFFIKVGSVLFGSGYVLLAFLRADLVDRWHWLTEAQLLDAVAAGQVTPGPVFTTATFIGYVLGGPAGAALATLGIFLPAFVLVAASGPLVQGARRLPAVGRFLDGLVVASTGLLLVVSWHLARAAVVDPATTALAVAALAGLLWLRLSSLWLIGAGAAVGMVLQLVARA